MPSSAPADFRTRLQILANQSEPNPSPPASGLRWSQTTSVLCPAAVARWRDPLGPTGQRRRRDWQNFWSSLALHGTNSSQPAEPNHKLSLRTCLSRIQALLVDRKSQPCPKPSSLRNPARVTHPTLNSVHTFGIFGRFLLCCWAFCSRVTTVSPRAFASVITSKSPK